MTSLTFNYRDYLPKTVLDTLETGYILVSEPNLIDEFAIYRSSSKSIDFNVTILKIETDSLHITIKVENPYSRTYTRNEIVSREGILLFRKLQDKKSITAARFAQYFRKQAFKNKKTKKE